MWMIAPAIGFLVLIVFLQFFPIGLWITALASGVPGVTPFVLIGMKLRKVPQDKIVLPLIAGVKAGLDLSVNQLETHFMARGNVETVVMAMISAQRAKIDLTFEQASAIDLAGRNPLEAVQMSVIPRVLETPVVAGVSQDGVELKAFARVTVRANASLQRLAHRRHTKSSLKIPMRSAAWFLVKALMQVLRLRFCP